MLVLLLLALTVGVAALVRRPHYARLTAGMYPSAEPARVEQWRRLELLRLDTAAVTSLGVAVCLLPMTVLPALLACLMGSAHEAHRGLFRMTFVTYGLLLVLLIGLVAGALVGGRAKRLHRELAASARG